MFRVLVRRSKDFSYFTNDPAREIDGLRSGGPGWWLRGSGDTTSPQDVAGVFATTERSGVQGYDIIIAAPRPISILLALDPEHGSTVVGAHRASVAASMAYLEQRGLIVRDRRNGEQLDIAARWENVVSFTHGVNRHGEPHLHDHVLVAARPEGARNVLDSRSLLVHVEAADALYRASLRHEVSTRTPWSVWRSFRGVEHVAGLDEGYRALWGGHHENRGEKLRWSRDDAESTWAADQRRFESEGVVASPRRPRDQLDEHAFAGALEGRSAVTRRLLVTAWANAAVYGQSPHDIARTLDDLYPTLVRSRGVREETISVARARMTAVVREYGPRPLRTEELTTWRQRSIERSRGDLSR